METYKMASRLGPSHALDSRFLVLIALQAAHLARVHLGHVHVCVDHEFVLANAGRGRPRVKLRLRSEAVRPWGTPEGCGARRDPRGRRCVSVGQAGEVGQPGQ